MKQKIFIEIICFFLLLLFFYSGTSKLIEHDRFAFQLMMSPFAPIKRLSSFISWVIPIAELLIVPILIIDKSRIYGLYFSVLLLSIFEIYIAAMFFSGSKIPCSCGGFISQMNWKKHLLFNAIFILLSIITIQKVSNRETTINLFRA